MTHEDNKFEIISYEHYVTVVVDNTLSTHLLIEVIACSLILEQ